MWGDLSFKERFGVAAVIAAGLAAFAVPMPATPHPREYCHQECSGSGVRPLLNCVAEGIVGCPECAIPPEELFLAAERLRDAAGRRRKPDAEKILDYLRAEKARCKVIPWPGTDSTGRLEMQLHEVEASTQRREAGD